MNENNASITSTSTTSTSFSRVKKCFYLLVKRLFDIVVSLIGILFLIPISLVIKIISLCHGDFYSIYYTQERIGKDGKPFQLYKYRSMVPNADAILEGMLKKDRKIREEYSKNKKLANDPRITKLGKFIRRYSIDELPQLLNVFGGSMSIIGNRPYLPREKKDMGKYYDCIVKTKPGITGYWQVSGRNDISFKRRLILEKYYSNNQSLKLDILIFFKTFKAVFGGKGAI